MHAEADEMIRPGLRERHQHVEAPLGRETERRAGAAPIHTHFSSGSSFSGGSTRQSARNNNRSSREGTGTSVTPSGARSRDASSRS